MALSLAMLHQELLLVVSLPPGFIIILIPDIPFILLPAREQAPGAPTLIHD